MKNFILTVFLMASAVVSYAQGEDYVYVEASELTLVGKLMPGRTSNPYHRVDTTRYKGFSADENLQVRMSAGMSCAFITDSPSIRILTDYAHVAYPVNTMGISARGYDLYVHQKDGSWLWAASGVPSDASLDKPYALISDMDGTEREFLLYFPVFSEENSIKIGVEQGHMIKAAPMPFRHRVAIWGSSYTHGSSTSRAGMTYPSQFSRKTGIQLLPLGCSGNARLQSYFCDVLVDVDAEAFIFDTFSNPSARIIKEKFIPFVDRMIAAHPGKPLIFQQTIYREGRNFSTSVEDYESAKMAMAEQLFKQMKSTKEGREKYKDVYLIYPDVSDGKHEDTVDGTHPDNYGYTLWMRSVERQILRILRRYGIR